MAFDKTLLFVAISLTLSNCWIRSAGANPVPTQDQLDQVRFYWMVMGHVNVFCATVRITIFQIFCATFRNVG